MSIQQLEVAIPASGRQHFTVYVPHLEEIFNKYEIITPLRQAHFLAQIAHESDCFRANKENLNYSAQALLNVFHKYFHTPEEAEHYARQPEKIANIVYAGRMGNGPTESGDGWKYRGRGLVQLTGKGNYKDYSHATGQDFVGNPDLLTEPYWSMDVAGWYWKSRNLNAWADKDDARMITKLINGGFNGLDDRLHYLSVFKKALNLQTV